MDNNVQNIRSGRALAGFGKFFSGLGLVIAAIGAILGGAVPVIIVGVVLLIIGGLMSSASGKKLQGAAQGGLAQALIARIGGVRPQDTAKNRASVLGAGVLVLFPALNIRMFAHTALAANWLVLLALWVWLCRTIRK